MVGIQGGSSPEQGTMYVENEHTGMLHPDNGAVFSEPAPEDSIPDGPSVNLLERNAHLQNMLRRLGVMSRTAGLQQAPISKLEEFYKNVDEVVGRAVEKSSRKRTESELAYERAFGMSAMIDSGLVTVEQAENLTAESYSKEVLPTFADSKGAKRRTAMKSWLNYQERKLMGLKYTRRPKYALPKPPEVVFTTRLVSEDEANDAQDEHNTEPKHRIALIHILTPEFQELSPSTFADITDELVARASPDNLRKSLLDTTNDGRSVVSYRSPDSGWIRMSVTPGEFGLFSRHIAMLANSAYNGVLAIRDKKLQTETTNPAAKARADDDLASARRGAMRQVVAKQHNMEAYLETDIMPRIEIVDKFLEMTANSNLTRGTQESVRERFELLREYVFGDMLDAIGNQKQWTEHQAERAVRVLQKRLYLDPDPSQRVANFEGMLGLAAEYYGRKRALVLGRIAESEKYYRKNPETAADIEVTDRSRKELAEQLKLSVE